jgi:hypothetical protein
LQQQCFSSGAFSRQIFALNFVKNYKLRRIRERITPSTKQAPDYSTLGGPVAEATRRTPALPTEWVESDYSNHFLLIY